MGRLEGASGAFSTPSPRVRTMAVGGPTDPRIGSGTDPENSRGVRPPDRPGATPAQPQGDRRERRLASGLGVFWLARVPEPSPSGEPGGADADALHERREPSRAGDQ